MIAEPLEPTVRVWSAGLLFVFFALAFALMWICFFTVAFVPIPAGSPLGGGLILFGAFAPALAAVAVTFLTEGRAGVIALLRRIMQWHVAAKYYVFALGFMVAIKLTAALIYRALTSSWPRFDTSQWYLIPFGIAFSTPFQAGEEIGWRGYALPRLADRFGLGSASVLPGFIWGVWHLPQFFIRDGVFLSAGLSGIRAAGDRDVRGVCLALRAHQRQPALDHAAACGDQQLQGHCPIGTDRWNSYVRVPRVTDFVDCARFAMGLCRVLLAISPEAHAGKHHKRN